MFVASFQPLLLVMVAVAGSLLLDEKLHLGRYDLHMLISCSNIVASFLNFDNKPYTELQLTSFISEVIYIEGNKFHRL